MDVLGHSWALWSVVGPGCFRGPYVARNLFSDDNLPGPIIKRWPKASYVPRLSDPSCTDEIYSSDFSSVVRSLLRCSLHTSTNCVPDPYFRSR